MAPLDATALALDPENALRAEAQALNAQYGSLPTPDLLDHVLHRLYPGRVALVSSFGAESSVLLHLLSQVDRHAPVLFVDTQKLFGETLRYRETLIARFGLTGVRTILPDPDDLATADPQGSLWLRDTDTCCHIRKVLPLERALHGFDAWITGRKRFQSSTRAALSVFEVANDRIKVNPLANWSVETLKAYAETHDLPPHPLVAQGFPSIGCMPCTDRVAPGEDPRAGRWRGAEKTECGIHLPTHGREIDGSGI
ncbi:phosphoadenylylsulfate reductase (thioredoxin) [Breoghania corrubedonensis]|uniref:Adenosine 5'-phosphosulfate reductase n=1 Tax=Breoghania corrubedonensis TaxID=665038 RepID=A0A2T5VFA8_9HYPH|nr:phosphoadenylyl-sulfate reductase [Breoghania corrubedonensis]PTW62429.1 phosphoadenylylsulfate reductase (thioredoxin) [Breoghania corrubedonensis]